MSTLRLAAFGGLSLLFLSACDPADLTDEVSLIQSIKRPAGDVQAEVNIHSGGGAAGWVYSSVDLIYGSNAAQTMLKISHGDSPQLVWTSDKELHVRVPCGEIHDFSNVFFVTSSSELETIQITLDTDGLCRKL